MPDLTTRPYPRPGAKLGDCLITAVDLVKLRGQLAERTHLSCIDDGGGVHLVHWPDMGIGPERTSLNPAEWERCACHDSDTA